MGIIQKQTIRGSIITYVGVIIGFLTTGVLLPNYISPEQIGVLNLLVAYSLGFATFATLGINSVSNRLFPYFRNPENKHNGYFFILFIVSIGGFFLSVIVFLLLKPLIIENSLEKSVLFIDYIHYILPLTFFTLIFLVLDIYYAVLFKAVKGIFIKEFLQRIFILIAIMFVVVKVFDFEYFLFAWIIALSLPGIILLLNLIIDKQFILKPNFSHLSTGLVRSMISVGTFGIVVAFSNILIQYVDRLMINSMLGLAETGIYSVAFFYGLMIIMPVRALNKISTVVIADAWKRKDIKLINNLYFSTTINQVIIGLLVFIGIWANIDNIMRILPETYADGKYVIFYIGLANFFVMASGVNGPILSTSKHFKVLSYFVICFGILIVITNFIFIKLIGITGAAIASAISSFLYCLMRYVFLLKKFKMQPYRIKHLIIVLFGIISFLVGYFVPDLYKPDDHILSMIIDIFVRSSVILITYGFLIIAFGISVQINEKYHNVINKLKTVFGKS